MGVSEVKTMKKMMITLIIGLFAIGAFGAMNAHGTQADLNTTVQIVYDNASVNQVNQGDHVKIVVTVKNDGQGVFSLSGSTPAPAYANIYLVNNGEKRFVEKANFAPRIVMHHVLTLGAGEKYTATIDWVVPNNITGNVEVDAWIGVAPSGSVDIQVLGTQSSAQNVKLSVSTDAQGYDAGDIMYIYVSNEGGVPATISEGFVVYDESGNVVANVSWDKNVELQPGHTLVYSWSIPYYLSSGWYYIMPYGTNQYVEVYIF